MTIVIDKILEGVYKGLFILALIVSIYYFGISFSLLVSIAFIFLLFTQKALQRILSSGISILAPFILHSAKASVLSNYEYKAVIKVVNGIFEKFSVNYSLTKDMIDTVLVYALLFVAASIFFREDKTTIGKVLPSDNSEFKDKTFIDRQDGFCKTLSDKLISINLKQNWNNELYVPIETEVELTKGHKIKRYQDLLKCLKNNKSKMPIVIKYCNKKVRNSRLRKIRLINRFTNYLENKSGNNIVYLVLGDPGSGKSVSLRKLCSELLSETRVTGKIPVYISLQTWMPETGEWSNKNLPTQNDLINYIKTELYKDGDYFTQSFLDDYFELLLEDGRFYFIFDSFDEMPCLMGGNENGELITGISELFHKFLTSINQNGGIIASRLYNRPSDDYLDQTYTLRLQRFDNARVRKMLKRYLTNESNNTILKLFKDRIDLVELCRNPLHLSLLVDYIKSERDFPDNQFELFKHFVEKRLENNKERIFEEGFTSKEIYDASIDLSVMMQKDRNFGLDFPMSRIILSGKTFGKEKWEKCIAILTHAKICRTGGNTQTVSFVHRRFQEFFFVEAIIRGKERISDKDLIGILDNTGMRDALVLYCQIAEEDKIRSIISFCFDTITANKDRIGGVLDENVVKIINSMYFLIEAFSNRKNLLKNDIEIIKDLRSYLKKETHFSILVAIVNSISLFDPEDIQSIMLNVFGLHNRWLNTMMVSKCQLIQKLDHKTETGFCQFFEDASLLDLIHNFNNLNFSLSLSDCFAYIRRVHVLLLGVVISVVVHVLGYFSCILYVIWMLILLYEDFFKNAIYNLLGGTLYRLNLDDLKYKYDDFVLIYNQPTLGIRSFIYWNLIVLVVVLFAVIINERHLILSEDRKENDSETTEADIRISRDLIVSRIKDFFSVRGPKSIKTSSVQNNSQVIIILFIIIIYLFYPNGLSLIIFAVLEVYVTAYYSYRCIHEIVIPLMKTDNIFDTIKKKVSEFVKMLPSLIIAGIPDVIVSFIVAFGIIIIIGIVLGVLLIILPSIICYLTGNELTYNNMRIIAAVLLIFILFVLFVFVIHMIMRDIITFHRLQKMNTKEVDRKVLVLNLKEFLFLLSRRNYVKRLMEKEIKLIGDWPDDYISDIQDDVLIRDLAIWDSKEQRIKNAYKELI